MKMRPGLRRCCAAFLLSVLLAAYAGQKVHIYNEDHAHFSAHCGDLVPDNGAHTIIVDRCIIDDFYFFPYLAETQPPHEFYAEVSLAAIGNDARTDRSWLVPSLVFEGVDFSGL